MSLLVGRRKWWALLGVVGLAVVGFFAVPWIYINVIAEEPAPELSFEGRDAETSTLVATGTTVVGGEPSVSSTASVLDVSGVWNVVAPSTAGYRVNETIAGQPKTAVGRTSDVTGAFTLSAADGQMELSTLEVVADVASMTSDSERRDGQFRGRIMSTDEFPVAIFAVTTPIRFDVPTDGTAAKVVVPGILALRGVEREVSFDVEARRVNEGLEVIASTKITFADFEIPNPSIGPVSTEGDGVIEVLITAAR